MKRAAAGAIRLAAMLLASCCVAAQDPPASGPPAAAVRMQLGLPSPLFAAAAAVLARLPGAGDVQRFAGPSAEGDAPVLLVAVPELALARLAALGRLRAVPTLGRTLPRRCRDIQQRYVLPFAMPYTVAYDPQVVAADSAPATWEQLVTRSQLHSSLGMVDPAVDPVPWLCCMTRAERRGLGEQGGFALWMSLDAQVVHYAASYDELLAMLSSQRIAATVLPTAVAETWRVQNGLLPLPNRPFDEAGPLSMLGVAIEASEQADIATVVRLAETVLDASTRAAWSAAAGLEAVAEDHAGAALASGAPQYDWQQAERRLEHFAKEIRGHGRVTEDAAETVEFVFALLFLGFIVFVWFRLRRTEATTP